VNYNQPVTSESLTCSINLMSLFKSSIMKFWRRRLSSTSRQQSCSNSLTTVPKGWTNWLEKRTDKL